MLRELLQTQSTQNHHRKPSFSPSVEQLDEIEKSDLAELCDCMKENALIEP